MPNQVLAVQDADGRPLLAQNYDPVTHQFVVQQCGPALTDATTAIPYAPAAEAPVDGFKASYSCGIGGLVVVTAATDFFTITGIAGRTVRITRCDISGAIATTADRLVWDFGNRPTKALVLRGATQVFAISCNALPTFSTATSFNVYIEWTEDTYS